MGITLRGVGKETIKTEISKFQWMLSRFSAPLDVIGIADIRRLL